MSLIADSGALYALNDAEDNYHGAVRRVIESEQGPIVVPMAILAEVDDFLRDFVGIDAELDFLKAGRRRHLHARNIDRDGPQSLP